MAHRPPSATTSFTFAPKQKKKPSARAVERGARRGPANGGSGEEPDTEDAPEDLVVCSFAHSSSVVNGWMQEATKGWKEKDKAADLKASERAQAFSLAVSAQVTNEGHGSETARRIGSRAGLGAEVSSRKRQQEV